MGTSSNTLKPEGARLLGVKVVQSQDLFGGARGIFIEHDGSYYRLMITKAGKLILNK